MDDVTTLNQDNLLEINKQEKKWLLKEKYNSVETAQYLTEAKLIDEGMPVAYLIGNIEFLGCHIDLSSRPLIPRAETEYWTDLLIKEYRSKYSEVELHNLKVLDVFAGSGCIGIALKKHLACRVDFAELKPEHCEQIKKNLTINFEVEYENIENTADMPKVFESNILESVPHKKYDLIVANPPYVPFSHKDTHVQESVNNYEDPDAVYAEDNGNALIKKLIATSEKYATNDGQMWIECDSTQTKNLKRFALVQKLTTRIIIDQYSQERVIVLDLN